jgi:hypothetical protein
MIGERTSEESAVVGMTPNVASRLQGIAQPDTVVIAPETRRLALDYFEYRDLGEQVLKGLPAPIHAWQVLGERAPRPQHPGSDMRLRASWHRPRWRPFACLSSGSVLEHPKGSHRYLKANGVQAEYTAAHNISSALPRST